jgi:hypothetical protein
MLCGSDRGAVRSRPACRADDKRLRCRSQCHNIHPELKVTRNATCTYQPGPGLPGSREPLSTRHVIQWPDIIVSNFHVHGEHDLEEFNLAKREGVSAAITARARTKVSSSSQKFHGYQLGCQFEQILAWAGRPGFVGPSPVLSTVSTYIALGITFSGQDFGPFWTCYVISHAVPKNKLTLAQSSSIASQPLIIVLTRKDRMEPFKHMPENLSLLAFHPVFEHLVVHFHRRGS